MLERIAKHEKMNLDNELLSLIAQYADFSFRDAAKILEDLSIQKNLPSRGQGISGTIWDKEFNRGYSYIPTSSNLGVD